MWPFGNRKSPRSPRPPEQTPAAAVLCPNCQGEELVLLKIAGTLRGGSSPEFLPTRAVASCAHCLRTYNVRLDGRAECVLVNKGPIAGAPGLMANDVEEREEPEAPRRPQEGDFPTDVSDIVNQLTANPGLSLG